MKRHILSTFLLLLIIQTGLFAQNSNSLFPLAIGNKYLYFYDTADTNYTTGAIYHSYGIASTTTSTTMVIDSMLFYDIGGTYYRYDAQNQIVYSAYFDPNYNQYITYTYANLSQLGTPILQDVCGEEQPCYKAIVGGPPTSDIRVGYFCNNIGLGYYYEFMPVARYYDGVHRKRLIGMINVDSINGFVKQDEAVPEIFEPTTNVIINSNKIVINTKIKHKFSFDTDVLNHITKGCCFIDTVKVEYFYKKGSDTLQHKTSFLSMDLETSFTGFLEFNPDLIASGYEIYYKISATDKALNPHTTIYPKNDYNKLAVDLTNGLKINYYPLSIGNYWTYDSYKLNNLTNKLSFNSRIKVSVIGDTILSNNIKYYKILNNNKLVYERIDSTKWIVYRATIATNNAVTEKPICYLHTNSGSQSYIYSTFKEGYFTAQDSSLSIFNLLNLPAKIYSCRSDTAFSFTLVENVGLLNEKYRTLNSSGTGYEFYVNKLASAKINNIEYGSTVLPVDALNRYPLKIGNKLTYEREPITTGYFPADTITVFVEKDTILANRLKYFKIVSEEETIYKRIDSLNGKVYLANISNNQIEDYLVDDLLAVNGLIEKIYYKNGFNNFSFSHTTYSSSIIDKNVECIKVTKRSNSQVYFTRCTDYGIVEECYPISTTSGIIYIQQKLISINTDEISNIDYYPLKINNCWIYDLYIKKENQEILLSRKLTTIVGDTIIPQNNKLYYMVKQGEERILERIDLFSGIVYSAYINANNQVIENPIYSLYDQEEGKVQSLYWNGTLNSFTCSNDTLNVFNNYLVASKSFTGVNNNSNSFTMCKGIGLYTESYSSDGLNYSQELKYAKVGTTTFGSKNSPANILNRLPFNVGYEYIYEQSTKDLNSTLYRVYDTLTVKIEKDSLLSNNLRYFKLVSKEGISFVRVDSVLGCVYKAQVNNNVVNDVLIDNLYALNNQTMQISYFNELKVFRYSTSNSLNDLECITAVSPYDSKIYFTRCLNVGILKDCRITKINDVDTYIYENLIGAKLGDSYWGDYEEITTGVVKPSTFDLSQNYPNPFNPSTTINYSIPKEGLVKIKVFDILGREVTQLVNSQLQAGTYKVEFNGAGLASGVYIYSLFVDNNLKSSKKMILIK